MTCREGIHEDGGESTPPFGSNFRSCTPAADGPCMRVGWCRPLPSSVGKKGGNDGKRDGVGIKRYTKHEDIAATCKSDAGADEKRGAKG
jgi:hypothetical protein